MKGRKLVGSLFLGIAGLMLGAGVYGQERGAGQKQSIRSEETASAQDDGHSIAARVNGFSDAILGTNFSVAGGSFRDFNIGDVGGADRIAVNALSASTNINQTRLRVFFGPPGVSGTVAGDIRGSDSPFNTVLNGFVAVHGSRCTIRVINDGSSPVAFDYLAAYFVR